MKGNILPVAVSSRLALIFAGLANASACTSMTPHSHNDNLAPDKVECLAQEDDSQALLNSMVSRAYSFYENTSLFSNDNLSPSIAGLEEWPDNFIEQKKLLYQHIHDRFDELFNCENSRVIDFLLRSQDNQVFFLKDAALYIISDHSEWADKMFSDDFLFDLVRSDMEKWKRFKVKMNFTSEEIDYINNTFESNFGVIRLALLELHLAVAVGAVSEMPSKADQLVKIFSELRTKVINDILELRNDPNAQLRI